MRKIAVFGGTFNPIHAGHIRLIRFAMGHLNIEKLILMPAFIPPHKPEADMAGAADRLAMCRIAARDLDPVIVSDMEIKRGGSSYTVDTLEALKKEYPDTAVILIVGADMLVTLKNWRRYEDIIKIAEIAFVPRPDITKEDFEAEAAGIIADGGQAALLPMEPVDISSTEIRRRIKSGGNADAFLPTAVAEYIKENRIYKKLTDVTMGSGEKQ